MSPFQAKSDHAKLLLEYLEAKGLEPGDFPEGLTPVSFPELLKERGYPAKSAAGRPFIFLRFLNHRGEPYYENSDTAKENPFELVRFLGVGTWGYSYPPPLVISQQGRPNVLHYEPLRHGIHAGRSWSDLPDGTKVLHLDSMIKAKAVHRSTGLPCIGLNGVESFSSSKKGVKFLYEDQEIDFSKFHNVVLFDSNADRKPIAGVREKLLSHFKNTMACKQVGYIDLPKSSSGEDWGPDEFLKTNGSVALTNLVSTPAEYKGASNPDLLKAMSRAVYCTRGGMVVDREDKHARAVSKARDFYAKVNEVEVINGSPRIIRGFDVWLASPYRTEVVNPAYEYLADEFIERDGQPYYNAYKPSGTWPDESDPREEIEPILRHLRSVMKPEDLDLLRSYGKFLKFSSAKPTSFPILYSDKRGVGKGWFTKILYRLIGAANSTNADARSFASNFNAQIANKRLVIINEFMVDGRSKGAAINSLKRFFGDEFVAVEPKGLDPYEAENRAGMIVTSNTLEDVPTDGPDDRRMWYVECHAPGYEPDWQNLHSMLDQPEVMNAIHDWFMEAEDINFSTWRPPMDERRKEAIRRSAPFLEDVCMQLLEDVLEQGIICAHFDTVMEMLKPHVPRLERITSKAIQMAMKRAGWSVSDNKMGFGRRFVWIADKEKFEQHSHEPRWIAAEIRKSQALTRNEQLST